MDPFLGQIMMFGGNFAPRGWAYCEGQLLAISQNQALFSILGTTYGGDGRTTFGLPDLRGRTPVHTGTGPGLSTYSLGERGGAETVSLTQSQMPAHTHVATAQTVTQIAVSSKDATSAAPAAGEALAAVSSERGKVSNAEIYNTETPNTVLSAKTAASTTTITNLPTGGSQPHPNMQPYLAVHYIIALQGLFPSRN